MQFIQRTILILGAVLIALDTTAAPPDPLFQDDATLKVEMTAPFSRLIDERGKEEELEGVFSYENADGSDVVLDLKVRARGKFRHQNCDFPPLFLNFKRSQLEGTLFAEQNKLKMVVHCKDSARYQQSLLREYLAYRMLNELTDLSFRARLLEITYVDSEDRRPRMVRYGFLIEHENRLAHRLGKERREEGVFPSGIEAITADHLNLTSVYQYLLSNTDFSPIYGSSYDCCHNYALFGDDSTMLLAIPYDFDMSGFVNAPYATPTPGLGLLSVRIRLYQGFCVNNQHLEASIAEFQAKREALYAVVADLEELEPKVRTNVARYMDRFYDTIGSAEAVEESFIGKCQNDD